MNFLDALSRLDGWRNLLSGLGVRGRDRAMSTDFYACAPLIDQTLSDLYHYNDLAALIVDVYPEDALRRGFSVGGLEGEAEGRWKWDLSIDARIQEASRWGRLFGLCVAVVYTDDGAPADAPIDCSRPWPVREIELFDRRYVVPEPDETRFYSKAPILRVQRVNGAQFCVHRSRCLFFGGAPTSTEIREQRSGADLSVLQRPYEIMRDYANGFLALGNMLTDASQGVFRMKGLLESLASSKRERLEERLSLLDTSRSVARMVFLDADGAEDFQKIATAFAGVPESIDRLTGRLSVATGIPVERLGQALAGLNATGESTTRAWYDRVESFRRLEITPQLRKLARIELGPGASIEVCYPPFWQPTDSEQATTNKTKIDAAALLFDREGITAAEISQLAPLVGVVVDPAVPRNEPPATPAPGTAPGAPPDQSTADDEEAIVPDEQTEVFAAQMTEHGAEMCEHGRRNRCPLCGIERVRGVEGVGPDGAAIFRRGWRAIPR